MLRFVNSFSFSMVSRAHEVTRVKSKDPKPFYNSSSNGCAKYHKYHKPNVTTEINTTPFTSHNLNGLSLIAIDPGSQLHVRLNSTNFPSYRDQHGSLMIGYELMGYFDGSVTAPP